MRAVDQSRNVRDRRPAIAIKLHYAHDRMHGRKWIGRDFRMGRGDFSQEGRLPGIRVADQGRVCHRPKLEEEITLLTFFALCVLNRGPVLRAFEMDVALAAFPAFAEDELLALFG